MALIGSKLACNVTQIPLFMLPQPDEVTCGPTCLHAVMSYWGDNSSLSTVIDDVAMLDTGGTLAVMLGNYALRGGYDATIYTYNLQTFDPTWFHPPGVDLSERLRRQFEVKEDEKVRVSSSAYLEFLRLGGRLHFEDLSRKVLVRHLERKEPIIAGLSATYLYRSAREWGPDDIPDDIRGAPTGHFVVICGFDDSDEAIVEIADPYLMDPVTKSLRHRVSFERLICSILLGVLTYDANLLVVRPRDGKG